MIVYEKNMGEDMNEILKNGDGHYKAKGKKGAQAIAFISDCDMGSATFLTGFQTFEETGECVLRFRRYFEGTF